MSQETHFRERQGRDSIVTGLNLLHSHQSLL